MKLTNLFHRFRYKKTHLRLVCYQQTDIEKMKEL